MAPKMGRPKSENPRCINLNIRLTKDEAQQIQECAELFKMSRTDTIIKGIRILKSTVK